MKNTQKIKPYVLINQSQCEHIQQELLPTLDVWSEKWWLKNLWQWQVMPIDNSCFKQVDSAYCYQNQMAFLFSADSLNFCFTSLMQQDLGNEYDHHPLIEGLLLRVFSDLTASVVSVDTAYLQVTEPSMFHSWGDNASGAIVLIGRLQNITITILLSPELTQHWLGNFKAKNRSIKLNNRVEAVQSTLLDIIVELNPVVIPVASLQNLSVGDVIMTSHTTNELVTGSLDNGNKVFQGKLTVEKDRKAIQFFQIST